ncbi:MAG: pectate lyase [Spirochaetales bacterium]|nr:pectate lyase [Spirochaetales bacterium]
MTAQDDLSRTWYKNYAYAFDNRSTYSHMRLLAEMYNQIPFDHYKQAVYKTLDYLYEAQYAVGGWPQFYPLRGGYYDRITYNDDVMSGIMFELKDIKDTAYPYEFLETEQRDEAVAAFELGIECILDSQITIGTTLTAWCQQHDEITLAPAQARAYEYPSITPGESVKIVRLLMAIENPSQEIIDSVTAAVTWMDSVKISGIRIQVTPLNPPVLDNGSYFYEDRWLVLDPAALPIWPRFCSLDDGISPIFANRDGTIIDEFNDLEFNRRVGYSWYGTWPKSLIEIDYPAWVAGLE